MPLKTKQIADKLGVSANTIRNYCTEFAEFLSSGATPGGGAERSYTETDIDLLATIAAWKKRRLTYEEIKEKLEKGEHWFEGIRFPREEAETDALVLIDQYYYSIKPFIQQLMAEREELKRQLREADREIGRLQALLDFGGIPTRDEVDELQRRIEELEGLLREAGL